VVYQRSGSNYCCWLTIDPYCFSNRRTFTIFNCNKRTPFTVKPVSHHTLTNNLLLSFSMQAENKQELIIMGITDVISLDVHFLSSNYYRDSGIQYHPVDIADEAEPTKNYIPLFIEASDLIDRITRKGGNLLCITILGPSWWYRSWTYNYMCSQCLSPLKL
jgi:hypothetical protein